MRSSARPDRPTGRPAEWAEQGLDIVHEVKLRKPLERALRGGHPWVFRDALEPFDAPPGASVHVLDKAQRFVAVGLADAGPIAVRVLSLQKQPLDDAFFAGRILEALALRAATLDTSQTDAYRLIHGEGDRLPGVVCDRYGAFAVLKLDGEAAVEHRERFARLLRGPLTALGIDGLLLRSGRKHEHEVELAWGKQPERELYVREHGMLLCTNLFDGQKTGLFLDHRMTRARVGELCRGASVLNLYGYTGGFSVAAGHGGASHVTTVDIAKPALALADKSWLANGLPVEKHESAVADAIEYVTAAANSGKQFGVVVADPPNFAPRHSARDAALHAYQSLHHAALRVVAPGGYYLAASCSSHITRTDFEDALQQASVKARRSVQVLERSGAPADHPRLLGFPEGDYLKVVLMRVA